MAPMSNRRPGARGTARGSWRRAALPLLALLSACGTTEFEARPTIPAPLITRIPIVVGVYVPAEFRDKVHREKRDGAEYAITVGKGQSEGFERLLGAMFARTVIVPSVDAGARTDPEIRGVFEPVLEEFAFITPADSGSDLYAVSVKYRINVYSPTGQLVDSWMFTGYGTQASSSVGSGRKEALQLATALAMRDAGAKLATEFREQAVVRGLLPADAGQPPVEVVPPGP